MAPDRAIEDVGEGLLAVVRPGNAAVIKIEQAGPRN
jgi:hypothetical protein